VDVEGKRRAGTSAATLRVSNSRNESPECLDDAEPTWEQGELL